MVANSDVGITLKARTDEFEARLKRAVGTFESLAAKGKDVTSSLDNSFKRISIVAKDSAFQIEKSFNALSIKSDLSLEVQAKALEKNALFFQRQYQKIANDANSSTAEVTRAFAAMNNKIRQLIEAPLKSSYSTLGILPTSSIDADKDKIVQAFEAIKNSGYASANDIKRAYESMRTELSRLDSLYLSDSEKVHSEALAMNKRFNEERIASDKRLYEAKIAAQRANHLAYERDEEDAFRINEKFNEAKLAADKRLYEAKIAAQRANHLAYERDEEEAFRTHERFIAERIASEKRLAVAQAEALAMNKRFNEERIASEKAANAQLEEVRKKPFETLKIMSSSDINAEKAKIVAAFNDIKNSGTKSGNDVKRAYASMNTELERLKRLSSGDPARNATKGINLLSLASAAAIVKIQLLYSLVNTTMSAIASIPRIAIDAVESYNAAAISNAAIITSMQKGVKDVGKAYLENKEYAEAVQDVLIKMDTQTAASGKNLTDMNQKFMLQGVLIDANNEKQKQGFLNIANALAALTANDANANLQYPQEIAALLRGEDRPSNKLFQTLNSLDNGKLKEHLELWKKTAQETGNYGLILEKLGPLLAGFNIAQQDINKLWETQKSTLATIRDEILRDGFGPEFDRMISKMQEVNEYGTANKDVIANMISGGFEKVHVVISTIGEWLTVMKPLVILLKDIVGEVITLTKEVGHFIVKIKELANIDMTKVVENIANSFRGIGAVIRNEISLFEYATSNAEELRNRLANSKGTGEVNSSLEKLQEKLKDTRQSFAFNSEERQAKEQRIAAIKEQISAVEKQKEAVISLNALNFEANVANEKLREKNKGGGVFAPPPPKNVVFGTAGDSETSTTSVGNGDKLLRRAEQLNEKLAELEKSHNEIILAENANARKLELQQAENNYDARIISLSSYIKKKQDIEVAAIEEEIRTHQETVAAFQKVIDTGNFGYGGDKGAADKVEAQIKLNDAIKNLKNSEAELAVVRLKNHNELSKYNREETDYVRNINIQYNEYSGNFVAAEKLRQESLSYTNELWRLQQDAIEGVVGAQEALAAFELQGQIGLKKAQTAEDFNNLEIDNSIFGSDNQFDSITDKYIEMYRNIRDAEDEFGEGSREANNLRWGSMVDMARDSMDAIVNLMMSGNKEMFVAGKALAISMAIINAAQSVTKALTLPYPMNFVVAGLVGAAAGVQVATIASQQYEGRALGGPVIAGQTYIVNENRRSEGPEYFTPGVSGIITPASKIRDASADDKEQKIVSVNQRIYVQGLANNKTASQIARESERKQRIAQVRFG